MYFRGSAKICKDCGIDAVSNVFPFFKRNDEFRQPLFLVICINYIDFLLQEKMRMPMKIRRTKVVRERYSHKMVNKVF